MANDQNLLNRNTFFVVYKCKVYDLKKKYQEKYQNAYLVVTKCKSYQDPGVAMLLKSHEIFLEDLLIKWIHC